MTMGDTTLGTYVRARRSALGLTQEALAESAGVSQAVVSDIERGRISLSSADIRRRLAAALGVTHLDLLVAAGELTADEARIPAPTIDPARQRVLDALHGLELGEGEMDHLTAVIGSLKRDRARREARARSATPVGAGSARK
jgi:transcriptional regulator with XRE-family HTH domain